MLKYHNFGLLIIYSILFFSSCSKDYCIKCKDPTITMDYMEVMSICNYYEKYPEDVCNDCLVMLLTYIVDYRTSTNLQFFGSSVYVRKIKALESISAIKSNVNIHSVPDALLIDKYVNWIKSEKKIDLTNICLVYPGIDSVDIKSSVVNLDKVNWSSTMIYCK